MHFDAQFCRTNSVWRRRFFYGASDIACRSPPCDVHELERLLLHISRSFYPRTAFLSNAIRIEEPIPMYLDLSAGTLDNSAWKESSMPPDSSSSEADKDTQPENVVHFVLGDSPDESPTPVVSGKAVACKEKTGGIVRSYSQDTNMLLNEDKTTSSFLPKTSYSENSLDVSDKPTAGYRPATTTSAKKPLRELPTVMSVDDETLSTDSNSTADNDELKRRRRKLHFPAFRKNKTKVT